MTDRKETQVVILCGGKGTRMDRATESKPKPMVEIGGKPMLWHIMKYYSCFGFNRFVLALGYEGEKIRRYFHGRGFLPWEISCIDTGLDTLKGGRIKRLEPYIKGEYFHLTYGDGLSDVDLAKLEAFHRKHGKTGTVTAVRPPSRFGEMALSGNKVKEFEEKPQLSSGHINGGFFIFNSGLLKYLTPGKECDFEFGPLQKLSRKGELMAYRHEGYWQCMDTVRDAGYLNKLWKTGSAPWKIWKR